MKKRDVKLQRILAFVLCFCMMITGILGNKGFVFAEEATPSYVEDSKTIYHTQTSGTTDYFNFSENGWTAMGQSTEHVWSDTPGADPSAIWYEVKFTGHKIDVYSGKNRPMGKVEYFIDGKSMGKYSLYHYENVNSTYITTFDGLEEGEHTFKAVATGEKDTNSTNALIDCAQVVVYYNRLPKDPALTGSIVDSNLQYTQKDYDEISNMHVTKETLHAWKNDKAVSEISLVSIDSSYTNVTVTSSDFVTSTGDKIDKSQITLSRITSVDAYTGMPGYGNPDREIPVGSREEANEVLYEDASTAFAIDQNQVQNIWVSIAVPKTVKAGSYTGNVTVQAAELETDLTFTYILEVADAVLADATDFKDGFDIELWQNPYRVAEYYGVEPFSEEHLKILKPHMELYKNAGGHAITTTIVEDAWAGQTYGKTDVKFPSMVEWTKKTDGSWEFDYSDFDTWVKFNKDLGIGDKIVCYSIAPWTNAVVYYDEASSQTVTKTLTAGSAEWKQIWTAFLNDLADHLVENGWFEQTYIGIDERGFSKDAFDLIDSIERGVPTPTKLKSAGAMDGFVTKKDLALRVDDLNVGSTAIKQHPEEFEQIRQEREDAGLRTTVYTCTGHIPGNFSLSAPGESYWTMMYAASVGGAGYLRWAYDSWVEDPLRDTTHNAFEAGDCFLVFPDEADSEDPKTKSSTRFEKMCEGVRDVNKLLQMKKEVPSMAAAVDALLDNVKPTYESGSLYLTDNGKNALAKDMSSLKAEIAALTNTYVEYKTQGTEIVTSVEIDQEDQELAMGKTVALSATVLPEKTLDNTVSWTSSNPSVAEVSDKGVVKAKIPGTAVITAVSNKDTSKKDTVKVVVKAAEEDTASRVSYYSFDSFDGNTVKDQWGTRNGIAADSCSLVKGKSGNALKITEAGQGIVLSETSGFTTKDDWTVAYWVKTTSDFNQEISVLEDSLKQTSLSLKMASDRASGFRVGDGSGDVLTMSYGFTKDQWYHVAWVQDADQGITLYVNGEKVTSNAWTSSHQVNAPLDVIGGTGFTGLIDEVKIYGKVLDQNAVAALMLTEGLNLNETEVTVNLGETYQIQTNLISDQEDKTITYASSDPQVISVSETGLVTALKKGTAQITVKNEAGGFSEVITITAKVKLYSNSRIPQYELPDSYLSDIEKSPNTDRQYLGQPDMVLTSTGRLITAYPVGHGHGPIVMQISDDNGETWTEKTNLPDSWKNCQETPTLYVLNLADGTERIMLISGCPSWDLDKGGWETSYSDDNGETWTEYQHFWSEVQGEKHPTVVAMASMIQLQDENGNPIQKWMAVYHDYSYINYKTYLTFDENGNEQWSEPEPYLDEYRDVESSHQICEVGLFRSPDGSRIVGLARSQSHAHLSTMFWSDDEGETWSEPIEIQGSLAGERHKAAYDPITGKLVITFREIIYGEKIDSSWMAGDWVAWVGTYDDLMNQAEGEYRILIEEDWAQNAKSGDTGYAGLVVLEDGTFIMDSYGHFDEEFSKNYASGGSYNVKTDLCYIKQAKFKLADLEKEFGIESTVIDLEFETPETEMILGEQQQLSLKNSVNTVTWKSSDESVLKVDGNGKVTAVGPGTAKITVMAGTNSNSVMITVLGTEKIFTDIQTSHWYYDAVNWNYANQAITGFTDGTFGAKESISRAQFITILYRLEGSPEVTYQSIFKDVPDGRYYTDAVIWGSNLGLIKGISSNVFGTKDDITREQMVTILYRYLDMKGYPIENAKELSGYKDTSMIGKYAKDAVKWAVENQILTGSTSNELLPKNHATRAESAAIIMRFYTNSMK